VARPEVERKMSTRAKVFLGLGLYFALIVVAVLIFGAKGSENKEFMPQNEFKLDPWFAIGPLEFNKASLYIILAGVLTVGTTLYVANRMQARPNRVQTAVEAVYTLMRDNIAGENLDPRMMRRWFTFLGTIFLFIWFSNLIGYIPLPTNTEHPVTILGIQVPSLALYAATANLSVPLVLAVMVWVGYNVEGIRAKGFIGYIRGLVPAGVPRPMRPVILALELLSNFMRLISLSVRLFANILAGHLIILFMAGALVVLLGIEALGFVTLPFAIALFLFEVGLVATLQAFIFATLAAIYLGEATAESH
jgi:F-type H+-transporting ATPase subunit a